MKGSLRFGEKRDVERLVRLPCVCLSVWEIGGRVSGANIDTRSRCCPLPLLFFLWILPDGGSCVSRIFCLARLWNFEF